MSINMKCFSCFIALTALNKFCQAKVFSEVEVKTEWHSFFYTKIAKNVFIDFALSTGALSYWNKFGYSGNTSNLFSKNKNLPEKEL